MIAVAYSQSQDDLDRLIGETFTDGLPFVTPEPIEQTHVQPGERVKKMFFFLCELLLIK